MIKAHEVKREDQELYKINNHNGMHSHLLHTHTIGPTQLFTLLILISAVSRKRNRYESALVKEEETKGWA